MSMNRVCVIGRIGKDSELRRTQSGKAVTNFPLAVDRDGKDAGTDWFDVVAWDTTAEFLSRYCAKGRKIGVDGRLQARDWTDQDGNKRYKVEIVAQSVSFADSKRQEGGDSPASYSAAESSAGGFTELEEDGDFPF